MTEQAFPRLQLPREAVAPALTPYSGYDEFCLPAAPLGLQDIVDAPFRTLEVEFKSWRNLDNSEDQAELARDIAALANIGGGHIVFGFNEATLAPADTEPFSTNCAQERVTAIATAYLQPSPRCDVCVIRSGLGEFHPVIRVGGHGVTPVCVRRDGPLLGGMRLLTRGDVYIRCYADRHSGRSADPYAAPEPITARIEHPQDWAKLIRRCVCQDRDALLGVLEAAITDRAAPSSLPLRLARWHDAARIAFLRLVPRSPVAARLERCHYALSYALDLARAEMLDPAQLPEFLRRCAFEAQSLVSAGHRMFEPPYRLSARARFATDPATGDDDTDFLEASWLRAYPAGEIADHWRVLPRGFATILREYAEDRTELNARFGRTPGSWLSPDLLARELTELVCHARALSGFFTGARRIVFRCEWWGLSGRVLFDAEGRWAQTGAALGDHRAVSMEVPVAALVQAWPDTVARLMAPVLRALEPDLVLGPDWVRAQLPRWRA